MRRSLATFAWVLTAYTLVVILWGAFVRATGAGAGCGSHWPLCNGEVVPRSPGLETLIEFTHRLTSGFLGLVVLAFVVAAFRYRPKGHPVRKGALWVLWFVVAESLVGAGLVKFEWVAADDSMERVYVMAFHLVNTLLLMAALVLTAWYAGGADRRLSFRGAPGGRLAVFVAAAVGLLLVGSSGAVTALGDTLVLSEGVRPEDSPVAARLVASRFYHPSLAVLVGAAVVLAAAAGARAGRGAISPLLARALVTSFAVQLVLGAVNVYLMAPIWMQLVHLALSNAIWILSLLLGASAFAART